MNLLRLILLFALLWLALRVLRAWRRSKAVTSGDSEAQVTEMLKCEHCGIYFAAGSSVRYRGHVYCSDAHRDRHHGPPPS
jgi:uncharacterized protein